MPMDRSLYPDNWDEIALEIKVEAKWTWAKCGRLCRKTGESLSSKAQHLITNEKRKRLKDS